MVCVVCCVWCVVCCVLCIRWSVWQCGVYDIPMSSMVMYDAGAVDVLYVPVLALIDADDVVDVAYKWKVFSVSIDWEL